MRTDSYRLGRIVELGDRLLATMDELHITRESLLTDYKMQWLVTTPLFNIGEQANCLSRQVADATPNSHGRALPALSLIHI